MPYIKNFVTSWYKVLINFVPTGNERNWHKKKTSLKELDVAGSTPAKKIEAPVMPRPTLCVSYGQIGYFPIFSTKGS